MTVTSAAAHDSRPFEGLLDPKNAVEHVFAGQKHRMKLFVRTVGLARAKAGPP